MYQTFKPLQDQTEQFSNAMQGCRSTVKYNQSKVDDIIDGQNQFIQILRDALEVNITKEDLNGILSQLQDMSREQKLDMFALVTQLYQELQRQNDAEINNLRQLNLNLNDQIECYVKGNN
ncbi:hypothetical protein pb186bvf_000535 [Paramecium bursaria]